VRRLREACTDGFIGLARRATENERLVRALCERAARVLPETRDWRDFRGTAKGPHG